MTHLPDPRSKPWLTVAELAAITGEGEKAIRAALDQGQLPMLRVGRYVRIPTAELLRQLGIDATTSTPSDCLPVTAISEPRRPGLRRLRSVPATRGVQPSTGGQRRVPPAS